MVGFRFRKRVAHVMKGYEGHAVEDGAQDDSVDSQAEAAEGLGKVQRDAHGAKRQPRSAALPFNSKLGNRPPTRLIGVSHGPPPP